MVQNTKNDFILAIDQGTTSSRAIVFDGNREIVSVAQEEFPQIYPDSGWVEHDPDEIWQTVVRTCREALAAANLDAENIAAIGITNQRETTIVWEKETGKPIHNAIVWQDRRTAPLCEKLKSEGREPLVNAKTGLLLDPYFSATKLKYILDQNPLYRERALNGEILFGTVECFLLWRLTGGTAHKCDATNAARTMLFNIHDNVWDKELCDLFDIPMNMLPEVEDCSCHFGETNQDFLGASIPILGMAGDQQAALIGQACFKPGMIKTTYGTGCFAILNTGNTPVRSKANLLTTIGYRLKGQTTYALEGSIFIAGAAVQWLRDGIQIIDDASESGTLASIANETEDVVLVPAFSGLGAPYWKPNVRGAMFGITRNTGAPEIAKAALEAVCFQTRDLIEAMQRDYSFDTSEAGLRVDGGMVASEWTMQALSNLLGCKIDRPTNYETTALGAAWLAASQLGLWPEPEQMIGAWKLEKSFSPQIPEDERNRRYKVWQASVQAVITQSE